MTVPKQGRKKRPIKTGLEIPVKPISDKGLTEEEYFEKVEKIRRDRELQERLNKLAEDEVKKGNLRRPKNLPPQWVGRPVRPRPQPIRGLLHPEPEPKPRGFMGLLNYHQMGVKHE